MAKGNLEKCAPSARGLDLTAAEGRDSYGVARLPRDAAQWTARARQQFAKGEIILARSSAWMAAQGACNEGLRFENCPFDPATEPVLHEAWCWWYPRAAQAAQQRKDRAARAAAAEGRDSYEGARLPRAAAEGRAKAEQQRKVEETRRAMAARSPAMAEQMGIEVAEGHDSCEGARSPRADGEGP